MNEILISLSYDFSSNDKLFQGDLVVQTYFSLQDEGYTLFENFDGFRGSGINYDSVCFRKFYYYKIFILNL